MPSDSDLELTSIRTEDLNLEDKDLTVEHVPVQVDAPEDVSESCLICVSRPRAVRFLPCRHATMCELCIIAEMQRTGQCPNCRRKVLQLVAVPMACSPAAGWAWARTDTPVLPKRMITLDTPEPEGRKFSSVQQFLQAMLQSADKEVVEAARNAGARASTVRNPGVPVHWSASGPSAPAPAGVPLEQPFRFGAAPAPAAAVDNGWEPYHIDANGDVVAGRHDRGGPRANAGARAPSVRDPGVPVPPVVRPGPTAADPNMAHPRTVRRESLLSMLSYGECCKIICAALPFLVFLAGGIAMITIGAGITDTTTQVCLIIFGTVFVLCSITAACAAGAVWAFLRAWARGPGP